MTDDPKRGHEDWWRRAVVYQVYPRSFLDSNGDGVGDLPGVTRRLDHLADLGVDAIWLSPFYPSPMNDFGYDVTDYTGVDPIFGTLDDFDALVERARERGIRVIVDFVLNHTSERHPWFAEARSSREAARRDWYVWAEGRDGGPPNNWQSVTGGPAWTRDEASGQFYLHSFLPCQPDLNWRNGAVREAMHAAARFWLERGVAGLRLDMLEFVVKDEHLRDEVPDPSYAFDPSKPWRSSWYAVRHEFSSNRPEAREVARGLRVLADTYGAVLIGELDFEVPLDDRFGFHGTAVAPALHTPFNFDLIAGDWSAEAIARAIRTSLERTPPWGTPNWVLGNHDVPRIATRLGPNAARTAVMLQMVLPGMAFVYQGEELGLPDAAISPASVRDPWGLRHPGSGRDPERAPLPWDDGPNRGFAPAGAEPWLPTYPRDVPSHEGQTADPASTLALYRRLAALRRSHPVLRDGTVETVEADGPLLRIRRRLGDTVVELRLNTSDRPLALHERDVPSGAVGDVLIGSLGDRDRRADSALAPHEAILVQTVLVQAAGPRA